MLSSLLSPELFTSEPVIKMRLYLVFASPLIDKLIEYIQLEGYMQLQ